MMKRNFVAWAVVAAAGTMAQAQEAAPPVHTTTAVVKPAPGEAEKKAASAGEIATADDLLSALETADKDLRTLRARVRHIKRESELVGNRTQERIGEMFYRVLPGKGDAPARKQFQIDFEKLLVDGDTQRDDRTTFVLDGQWLVEKQHAEKQVFKRQLAPTGEHVDPMALGEGRFPVPIGQKKERILELFDAELAPPADGFPTPPTPPSPPAAASGAGAGGAKGGDAKPAPVPSWVERSYQLKLTPKRGTNVARDFREIRVWYQKDGLLPAVARTVNIDGSTDDVILTGIVTNRDLPPGVFDTSVPEGWDAEISEYRGPAADD